MDIWTEYVRISEKKKKELKNHTSILGMYLHTISMCS